MRDSFVFYRSFWEAVKDLPEEQFKSAISAIAEYALDDKVPETAGIEKTIYLLTKPQIDANYRKYQNGTKGGRPKTGNKPNNNQTLTKSKPTANQEQTKHEPNVNDNVNVNVNVNDNDKNNNKAKRFVPPTESDVEEYCSEKGYSIDAGSFIDFYEAKGWMIGKNKMKDWKAAVRNWNRSQRQGMATKGGGDVASRFLERG